MRELNAQFMSEQETTLESFFSKNKAFYEQFKKEDFANALKREIKHKQSFGNKDKQFKKTLS